MHRRPPLHPTPPILKTIQPHLPILAPTRHQTIIQPHARHRAPVPHKRRVALPAPWLPALDHAVIRPANHPDRVPRQRPHPFQMAKHGFQAAAGGAVPQADGTIQRAGEEIPRGKGTGRVGGEPGAVRCAQVEVARGGGPPPVGLDEGDGGGPFAVGGDGQGVGVVCRVGGVATEELIIGLVLRREEQDLLRMPDVALKSADDLAGVEVPQLEGGVVRGGHDGAGGDM